MPDQTTYQRWKARKLAADPDFFKHDYQRRIARYGKDYFAKSSTKWREGHREYFAEWRKNHPEYFTPKRKEWRQRAGKHNAEYVAEWHKNHPDSYEANKFMASNRDKIPLAEYCEVCPEDDLRKATQRHHPDYDYPQIIVSCCSACHAYLNKQRIAELVIIGESSKQTMESK